MQADKINESNNCKSKYRCILTTVVFTLLAASSLYLFVKYTNQSEIVQAQTNYINRLKVYLNQNHAVDNIDSRFNKLFGNTWFEPEVLSDDIDNFISAANPFNIILSHYQETKPYSRYTSINISARESEYIVTVALPGFTREEVSIELLNNILKMHATKLSLDQDNKKDDKNQKQQFSELTQSIKVPSDIDQDNVVATLNNGLLTITLPRVSGKACKEAKKILIN